MSNTKLDERYMEPMSPHALDEQHVELLPARATMLLQGVSLGTLLNSVVEVVSKILGTAASLFKG